MRTQHERTLLIFLTAIFIAANIFAQNKFKKEKYNIENDETAQTYYRNLVEKMKNKADSLIIANYSQTFYDNHVRFMNCGVRHDYWEKIPGTEKLYWGGTYLGGCTKQETEGIPNFFTFAYHICLNKDDYSEGHVDFRISLDSLGNYALITENHIRNQSSYGLEKVSGNERTFKINKDNALNIAKQQGLVITDSSAIRGFLRWENFEKPAYYNGQFRYYILNLKSKNEFIGSHRVVVCKYDAYIFNPWTGEFIEKKKMQSFDQWALHGLSGVSSGLVPDDE